MKALTMEEYKQRVLEVLIAIDRICRENGLDYMILYGTLLGAVRHGGFIPWDDDVDIVMPRADYRKLGDILLSHPEYGLNYFDISRTPDSIFFGAKVCDAKTRLVESNFRTPEGYGAFVDVFALDSLADDEAERDRLREKYLLRQKIAQHAAKRRPGRSSSLRRQILLLLAFAATRPFSASRVIRRMTDRIVEDDQRFSGRYLGVPWDRSVYTREMLEGRCELEFAGHSFLAPAQWEACLIAQYGESYRTPIPPDEIEDHALTCYWRTRI